MSLTNSRIFWQPRNAEHFGIFFFSLFRAKRSDFLGPAAGCPDWANFRLLGEFLLWAVFLKITKVAHVLGYIFSTVIFMYYVSILTENMEWATIWAIFQKLIWSP
jgi:hypothetical protein